MHVHGNIMDDLNLDELEKDITNTNAVKDKFTDVLKHKKIAEDKLEIETKARTDAESEVATLKKETSFLNSFTDVTAKFPTASEYRDKIKEKVMSGYSVDDATISILVAEGKYTPPAQPRENAAGGSAINQITQPQYKSPKEMTSSERWDALREAERRGDISMR